MESVYQTPVRRLNWALHWVRCIKGFAHELNAEDLVWVKTQTTSVPSPANTRIELEPLIYQRRSEAGLLHMRMYLIGSP